MKTTETKPLRAVPLQRLVMALFVMGALYLAVAWPVFQWRNPLSNEMSFFRNFADVVTWKKLPEYQP